METRQILNLLHGGDWACALNEREGLRQVCRSLARGVPPELAREARAIARRSTWDMKEASHKWADLASRVRRQVLERKPARQASGVPHELRATS